MSGSQLRPDVAELRARIVSALVNRHNGKRRGKEVRARCPIHGGKHGGGTFSFNTQIGAWHCFKCGARGGYVELARALGILGGRGKHERRKIRTIKETANAKRWPGMAGATDREVILAVIDLAHRIGKLELTFSERQLVELAGISRPTARKSLVRLCERGWLTRLERGYGRNGSRWRLCRPDKVHREEPNRVLQPPEGCNGKALVQFDHDALRWRALGKNARLLLQLLEDRRWRVADLARASGLHRNTVRRILDKGARSGIVSRCSGRWTCISTASTDPTVLDAVAAEFGTLGDLESARDQHAEERLVYRAWTEAPRVSDDDVHAEVVVLRQASAA